MHKFLLFLVLLSFSSPAFAHKVVASGWIDGNDIEGEVGFSNGDMAKNGTEIVVLDAAGNELGKTSITDDGLFRFTPTQNTAHTFRANLGAGHVAEFTMTVDELPDNLKTSDAQTQTSSPAAAPKTTAASYETQEIATLVAKAVRKEIQPLRKEIAQYKEKNNLQNILGGIGYILGLTGVVFYIMARRKLKEAQK